MVALSICRVTLRPENIEELAAIPGPWHLALGVFDGVHGGHREVIRRAVQGARREGGKAAVVTFDPHPIRVLAPDKAPSRLLASLDHKAQILGSVGVDKLFVIHFDKSFAALEAEGFIEMLCRLSPDLRRIAVGEDWRFGAARRGDVAMLERFGRLHGFVVDAVAPVIQAGERISSTRIRQAIRDGNLAAAAAMLGRNYTVTGSVLEGRKLGRTLGFPTANILTADEQLPPDGVWVVRAKVANTWYQGVANLGRRPTVEQPDAPRLLETHLFDFAGDLYGASLEVEFVRFVRGERKFASLDELREAIGEDVAAARAAAAAE
jgi:riboflavin kinase/FMN adenylyltransferase